MATGRKNKLTGQIAEHLVCAELGRRNLIATPFAGNVPTFDVIAADEACHTVAIQVKATTGNTWPSHAQRWMRLTLDKQSGVQHYDGPVELTDGDLIYVCVALGERKKQRLDRFFILTKREVQQACIDSYTRYMEPKGWRRPRSQASFDNRFSINQIARFEDNWDLVKSRLSQAVG